MEAGIPAGQSAAALGIGKLITSITMTVFYLILYYVWRDRCRIQGRKLLTGTVWSLAALSFRFYLPQETGRLTRRVEVPAGQFLAGGYFSFSGSKTGVRRDPFDRSPEVPPGL